LITIDKIIIEVIGKKILEFSFSILISPGSLPNQLKLILKYENIKPKKAIINPKYIKNFDQLN